jgi:serine/threonine protein kinase
VILFCCSLRASPFYEYNKQGKIQDTKQLLWEINDNPSSANLYWDRYLRRRSDLLPADLKNLVVRMLSKNPANRPTIEEIKADDYFTGTTPT